MPEHHDVGFVHGIVGESDESSDLLGRARIRVLVEVPRPPKRLLEYPCALFRVDDDVRDMVNAAQCQRLHRHFASPGRGL
jgi:hypothetical protein